MTQAEKDEIIKKLQDKLAEAEKIEVDEPKQPKCWKPKEKQEYFCEDNGRVDRKQWFNSLADQWRYFNFNCFQKYYDANYHVQEIRYTAQYKNYIEEHSEPIDWDNGNQLKYYVRYGCGDCEIEVESLSCLKVQGVIYASSKEIILDAIKEIGEDNFKKYVLGVK